jgi:hypothetical protein
LFVRVLLGFQFFSRVTFNSLSISFFFLLEAYLCRQYFFLFALFGLAVDLPGLPHYYFPFRFLALM